LASSIKQLDRYLSPVHTGDKVEFNTIDFVESRQSRPRCFGPVHTGDKVDRIGNKVDRDKLSNTSCCRFVAKTGNKVDVSVTKLTISATVDFVADLLPISASRLC